ncbi:MAG: hypothetical protein QOH01_2377 [Verrucomicrobiota bacterium]|jgi:hypothetical protein
MRALLAPDILRIWETGRDQPPLERALSLLLAAEPETRREDLAALTIGRRDALLLALRRRVFGETVQAYAECPQCGGRLELHFPAVSIQTAAETVPETLELRVDAITVRLRFPTSVDLAEANGHDEIAVAHAALMERCVEARVNDEPIKAGDLPAAVIEQIECCMAEAEPGAEIWLDLRCPFCEHGWQALFDIAAFFWREISVCARRLLHEVNALARAYGWSEAEILGLSPIRRQAYLELVGA